MRQIGVIPSEQEAKRFAAYLLTLGVSAHAEPDGSGAAIWVRDENQLAQARDELSRFRENPADTRYQGVEREAANLHREQVRHRDKARKNVVEMRGRWGRPQPRKQPLTMVLIGLSILVALLTGMGKDTTGVAMTSLLFKDPLAAMEKVAASTPPGAISKLSPDELSRRIQADPLSEIRRGEVWRVITPIFVHYGWMHLIFNMIMTYQLGGSIEQKLGIWKYALIVLVTGAASIGANALMPLDWQGGVYVGGISGVIFGFVGYMWMKTTFDPAAGIYIPASTVAITGIWMFLGFFGILEKHFGIPVANWAHGVGLVSGMLMAVAPLAWKAKRS